ncbi:MAG: DNA primase [Crocinitomicaceae bacterium]|nr:DNA primase [Crocinitomicaceae bacterium]MBT6029483.1 DNA primase [Crocinitomicaceae bacterium]MBT6515725.1 DNA primase [Crocinitomicaceae bacterium]
MIPKDIIDKIFETSHIEEVIGEFVHLKKSGSNFKGLSPFVNEKTPSFMVSPAKGIFKDFSSGKGGNVVSFLMEHEGFSYPEALKWLGKYYNIEIPERELTDEEREKLNERESLFVANAFAQSFFVDQLEAQEGKAIGLSYFSERGYRDDIVKKFQLGYSPDQKDALINAAEQAGHNITFFTKLGLIKSKENGDQFDFFRGRVMFPIHSLTGRVLGFGGRTLRKDKKTAKYFNSPESPIYHKSDVLYGIYFARKDMMNQDNCYLVEGYTDVISMHQSGIENVVSSSGTALTNGQIRLIKRFTPNITILYDGDAAGIRASFRGIDLILQEGMNVKVVLFPDGEDPDSYSKKVSSSELATYLDTNAKDFISFKTDILLAETQNDPIKKSKLIREILNSIALVPDQISQSVYVKQASSQFDIAERTLISELNKIKRTKFKKERKEGGYNDEDTLDLITPPDQLPEKAAVGENLDSQELDLLRLMLLYGTYGVEIEVEDSNEQVKKLEVPVVQFILDELAADGIILTNEIANEMIDEFNKAADSGIIPDIKHFVNHQNQKINSLAVDLTAEKYIVSENWAKMHNIYPETEEMKLQRAVEEAVWIYKLRRVRLMKSDLEIRLKNNLPESEQSVVMKDIIKYNEIITVISNKLDIVVAK